MVLKHLLVNNKEYHIIKLLGKGKGGYSYLANDGTQEYVLRQIHHEPCSYYEFGNKIEAEINDYGVSYEEINKFIEVIKNVVNMNNIGSNLNRDARLKS